MVTVKVISEGMEFFSPYTNQPLLKDGALNTDDPSLKYVYLSEFGEFDYNQLKLTQSFNPKLGCDEIDLLVELNDGLPGTSVYVGYADIHKIKEAKCKSMS